MTDDAEIWGRRTRTRGGGHTVWWLYKRVIFFAISLSAHTSITHIFWLVECSISFVWIVVLQIATTVKVVTAIINLLIVDNAKIVANVLVAVGECGAIWQIRRDVGC